MADENQLTDVEPRKGFEEQILEAMKSVAETFSAHSQMPFKQFGVTNVVKREHDVLVILDEVNPGAVALMGLLFAQRPPIGDGLLGNGESVRFSGVLNFTEGMLTPAATYAVPLTDFKSRRSTSSVIVTCAPEYLNNLYFMLRAMYVTGLPHAK